MQSSLYDDPDWRSAIDLAAALRRRETSAAETLEAVLERADRVGPVLNPISVRLDRRARESARAADAALARREGGPLSGVPATIKDSHWLVGVETTYGSPSMVGFVPPETSSAVERLIEARAVVFAKTTVSFLHHNASLVHNICHLA